VPGNENELFINTFKKNYITTKPLKAQDISARWWK